jgi:hypothetical protein
VIYLRHQGIRGSNTGGIAMKKSGAMVVLVTLFAISAATVRAQEKPKADAQTEDVARVFVRVKVQFVLNEFDGDKKIATLPYSFLMNTEKEKGLNSPHYSSYVRSGVRLATSPDKDGKPQYLDIGSNIDCALTSDDAGRYLMRFSFERASLAPPGRNDSKADPALNYAGFALPTFRSTGLVPLKEGQATEVMSAVDPLTGHISTLTVTITAQK